MSMHVQRCEFVNDLPCREVSGELTRLKTENAELRELVRDYEELAAALCDARECDGCPFDSASALCMHMQLVARMEELGVDT